MELEIFRVNFFKLFFLFIFLAMAKYTFKARVFLGMDMKHKAIEKYGRM